DRGELMTGLEAVQARRSLPGVVVGATDVASSHVAFMFPGQGSQWRGMVLDLLESSAVFSRQMEECSRALEPFVAWRPYDVLRGSEAVPDLDRVDVVQPVLFAVMVSLAELWRACGVRPGAVVGHSQGEIAAAYMAGALSLDDAARVVALRSQALRRLAGRGGMVALPLSRDRAAKLIAWASDRLAIAAVNGPSSTVVSGDRGAL